MEGNNNNNKKYYKYHNNHYNGKKYYYKNNKKHNKYFYYYKNKNKNNQSNQNINEVNKTDELQIKNNVNKEENFEIEKNNVDNEIDDILFENLKSNDLIGDGFNKKNDSNYKKENIHEDNINKEKLDISPIKKNKLSLILKKINLKYAVISLIVIVVLSGATFSYFTFFKEDTRQADISSGEVYVKIKEPVVNLSLTKIYPRTKEEARTRSDNYVDFTIKGKNTSTTKEIKYVLNITNGEDVEGKERINPQYLSVDLEEKVNGEYRYIKNAVPLSTFDFSDVIPINTTSEVTREFRLRIWVNDTITISDTESLAAYTQEEFNNLYANFHVEVNSGDKTYDPS